MAKSKFINTFDTTAEYEAYIESALPQFPNVGYDKQAGKVNIVRTSPNAHVIYGELIDDFNGTAPIFKFNDNNNQKVTAHIDSLNNTFYVDTSDMTGVTTPLTSMAAFFYSGDRNIKTVKYLMFDTSNVTSIAGMCSTSSNLTVLKLNGLDFSNVTVVNNAFSGASSLTDVYINVEATLMKLTNNLSSQGYSYIPSNNGNCTIHYNDVDYKWQNNAWTPQS